MLDLRPNASSSKLSRPRPRRRSVDRFRLPRTDEPLVDLPLTPAREQPRERPAERPSELRRDWPPASVRSQEQPAARSREQPRERPTERPSELRRDWPPASVRSQEQPAVRSREQPRERPAERPSELRRDWPPASVRPQEQPAARSREQPRERPAERPSELRRDWPPASVRPPEQPQRLPEPVRHWPPEPPEQLREPRPISKSTEPAFEPHLETPRRGTFYWITPLLATVLFAIGIAHVLYLKVSNIDYFWYRPWANTYSLLISFYILSRFFLSVFYRPPREVNYKPTVSAVIACKNEEDSIARTIECLYASDYPAQRFEVIAVNDGSTDRTLDEMRRMKQRY